MTFINRLLIVFSLLAAPVIVLAQANRRERGNLIIEGIPEIPNTITEKLYQYQSTRSAGVAEWLPDGKGLLITTRFGETAQLHLVEQPGVDRRQITFFPELVTNATFPKLPQSRTFYFLKDVGGGEFYQIFSFDMNTGAYAMLTDGKSRNSSPKFANKSDQYIFTSTGRNRKDNDFYISPSGTPEQARLLKETEGAWAALEWSPDDQQVLVSNYRSVNENFLHLLNTRTGQLTQINSGKKGVSYGGAVWAKDSKGLFIISDEGSEFQVLKHYDLTSGKFVPLTAAIRWDVEDLEISEDGKWLAFRTNEDGISRLYLMDTRTRKYNLVSGIPDGVMGGLAFSPDNTHLAFSLSSARTPGDVYVLNASTGAVQRWTNSEVGGLNRGNFVSPQLVRYETFDKVNGKPRTIPAFYYKPQGSGKFPVVIQIHGGPEGQFTPGFSWLPQYLANEMGIALIAPNVRGSTGYGKTYVTLDNGLKREESVQDIGKLLDWIARQPELDAARVIVYGGSYGGYMTLASLTHFNDRLRGGIDVVGISNWITFLEKTEAYRRDLRRVEYGDERDPKMREFLTRISPVSNAQKITKPLFVIQGVNDPRVPVSESEQMVQAVRKNGGTVWYLAAKDEGHGFRKKSNSDYQTAAMMLFMEKYLKGEGPVR
jgi:dipeptidyl aminopeptidase/acylaminoacyl peptidase